MPSTVDTSSDGRKEMALVEDMYRQLPDGPDGLFGSLREAPVAESESADERPGRANGLPTDEPWIRLYVRPGHEPPWLVPSPVRRRWYWPNAYHCLPLLVAGQLGWSFLSPFAFSVVWDGEPARRALRLSKSAHRHRDLGIRSIFGYGVLSLALHFHVRTSPEVDLLVKAPPNAAKDGVSVLEGLVETDWFDGSFNVNLRFTRPNLEIRWERGEPLFQLVPYPRGWLERFRTETVAEPAEDPEFYTAASRWDDDRQALFEAMRRGERVSHDAQYRRGRRHDGGIAPPSHRRKLTVKPFPGVELAPPEL